MTVKKSRFRVLLTDGSKTIDLIWVLHNGKDIYYGYVGADTKYSAHESGEHHQTFRSAPTVKFEKHLPLKDFKGEKILCTFGFSTKSLVGKSYDVSKDISQATLYLDSRALPEYVNVQMGILEPAGLSHLDILQHSEVLDVWNLTVITSTIPWIYFVVDSPKEHVAQIAKELMKKLPTGKPNA